jgi:hypothetical protein
MASAFRNFLRDAPESKGFPFVPVKFADLPNLPEVTFPMLISSQFAIDRDDSPRRNIARLRSECSVRLHNLSGLQPGDANLPIGVVVGRERNQEIGVPRKA